MITLEHIRWQNILATGNDWIEISLLTPEPTLIIGSNGVGKSTFIDAIYFALFNRSFRNVRKDQIVNSITEKDALVELTFTKGNNRYLIRRGIKPTSSQ